jgi:hypothetical protein
MTLLLAMSASLSVVLPWSTCASTHTLRTRSCSSARVNETVAAQCVCEHAHVAHSLLRQRSSR